MRFLHTAEQDELRALTRRFLADRSPIESVRRATDSPSGHEPAVWSGLAELGLLGLAVPERLRGGGATLVEVGVVLHEAGRALLPSPLLANSIATCALLLGQDDALWLPELADGRCVATVAFGTMGAGPGAAMADPVARRHSSQWTVIGEAPFVLTGSAADLFVVCARTEDGTQRLFAVAADAPGLIRTALPVLDPTRRLADVTFAHTPATLIALGGNAVRQVCELAAVLLAAEQVGGAERCLQDATGYATLRTQFDAPIGSFQAIKHLLADTLVEVESARAAADYALCAAVHTPAELSSAASLAKAVCSEAYLHAAKVNFQVHGGIAFTWEHDAHLHLKRAMAGAQLFGSPAQHRERIAALVLDGPHHHQHGGHP